MAANLISGGSRDLQTTSTLTIIPRREDDGAKFMCVVWNRALPEGHRLETVTTLSVNCEYLCVLLKLLKVSMRKLLKR